MRSALLLTASESIRHLVGSALGRRTHLILVSPADASTPGEFEGVFRTWLGLTDVLIIDCISLGENSKSALESLQALSVQDERSVVVFLTSLQRSVYASLLSSDWLVLGEKSLAEDLKQSLVNFLDLHYVKARSKRLDALTRRQNGPRTGAPGPSLEGGVPAHASSSSYRYRDALKQISRLLAQPTSEAQLIRDFLALLRELLGLSRLAFLVRESHMDLGGRNSASLEDDFVVVASTGLAPRVTEQLRLGIGSGIPHFLASEAKILCRNRGPFLTDEATIDIEREFEQLKTDVALPVFTNEDLTGIFTCGGKITGEPLTNDELELSYHLVSQLGNAILGIRLNNRVSRQERFMSRVLAEIQSGVLVLDSACRVLVVNERARQLLGLGTEDPVKSNQLPARVADVVFESLQTGAEIRGREVLLPGSGRQLSVSVTRLESDGDDKQEAAVSLIEDLTRIRTEEAQTQRLREQELFMRLAYRLSHELKNSLVSVKTFLQLLPQYTSEEKAQGNFAGLVLDEVGRIDSVVQNLSFFAQPREIAFEDVPVSELLRDSVNAAAKRAVFRKLAHLWQPDQPAPETTDLPVITVKLSLNHRQQVIRGDRKRLTEALQELILNAVQSMPSGGRILITSSSADDTLTIEIKDTGQGISLEDLQKVTEPFFTTRNVGIGLGLTVVEKTLSWHSGRLTIDSTLGQGAAATVHLPVRPPGASDEEPSSISDSAHVSGEQDDSRA